METVYQHILLAIDISQNSEELIKKASRIKELLDAKITILHVLEPSIAIEHIYVDVAEVEEAMEKGARKKLGEYKLSETFPGAELKIEFGIPKEMILKTAKNLNCDLIVVGSHGRHGLQKILGSTTNAILNIAQNDVLVIRCSD